MLSWAIDFVRPDAVPPGAARFTSRLAVPGRLPRPFAPRGAAERLVISMRLSEIIVFIVYLLFMLSIGVYFFIKDRNGGEKSYFLGGREMGAWGRRPLGGSL